MFDVDELVKILESEKVKNYKNRNLKFCSVARCVRCQDSRGEAVLRLLGGGYWKE